MNDIRAAQIAMLESIVSHAERRIVAIRRLDRRAFSAASKLRDIATHAERIRRCRTALEELK